MAARLKQIYSEKLVPELKEKLGLKNTMQVPRILKITVNMGVGEAVADKKVMDAATADMTKITGQKPAVTKAKKSVATFKVRDGQAIGCKVTLRGDRMYEFLDRLVSIAIPRIRDFRGLYSRSFDGRGNYSMGVREQIIFPEIDYDAIDQVRGLDITITTSAPTDVEAFALLSALGMPFSTYGRPAEFAQALGESAETAADPEVPTSATETVTQESTNQEAPVGEGDDT